MTRLVKLFEPIKIGRVELKNRIVCLAMGTGLTDANAVIKFYSERAKGGASIVFVPLFPVDPGLTMGMPGIWDDEFMPFLREMAKSLKAHGAVAGAQLFFMNELYTREKGAPTEMVGPSSIAKPLWPPPRPLTVDEIESIVERYGEAARRAREAGFDVVEFHFGIGYLVCMFISPYFNNRTDEYGGSLEKRMKLPLDIIASAKKKAGEDFTYSCRFSADELIEGGHTLEDGIKVAQILEKAGIHLLNVQCGWHESPAAMIQMSVPRGSWVYITERIKKVVKIPVLTAYRINDPIMAEEILVSGKADLIGMARALIADPELPNKAKEGRFDDIRPCTACCYCLDQVHGEIHDASSPLNRPVACAVNAQAGHETKEEYIIKAAKKPKRTAVVGGGPAGMEAARVAALRGHKVTLYEKDNKLGGLLNVATIPPYKEELGNFRDYLDRQMKKQGVKVKLGEEFTEASLKRDKPEVVVLATGHTIPAPDIPGIEKDNVVSFMEALTGAKEIGYRVLVVGGGKIGCEVAEFLNKKGKQVTVFEKLPKVIRDVGPTTRFSVMMRLKASSIKLETNARVVRIAENGVEVERNGAREFFKGDTVVLATGSKPNDKLAKQLEGKISVPPYRAGDCVEPRWVAEAIDEGFRIGASL
jgi:2,4-dienoyl-CoA reductase (NADPH2)